MDNELYTDFKKHIRAYLSSRDEGEMYKELLRTFPHEILVEHFFTGDPIESSISKGVIKKFINRSNGNKIFLLRKIEQILRYTNNGFGFSYSISLLNNPSSIREFITRAEETKKLVEEAKKRGYYLAILNIESTDMFHFRDLAGIVNPSNTIKQFKKNHNIPDNAVLIERKIQDNGRYEIPIDVEIKIDRQIYTAGWVGDYTTYNRINVRREEPTTLPKLIELRIRLENEDFIEDFIKIRQINPELFSDK